MPCNIPNPTIDVIINVASIIVNCIEFFNKYMFANHIIPIKVYVNGFLKSPSDIDAVSIITDRYIINKIKNIIILHSYLVYIFLQIHIKMVAPRGFEPPLYRF